MRTSAVMSDEPVISFKTEVNAVKVILLFVLGLKTRSFADVMSGQQRNFWSIKLKHLLHRPKLDAVAVAPIFPLQEQHSLYLLRLWIAMISAFAMWSP